ncbi:2-dehydro-3-deoxyphosphogluconate aldolase [Subtercola sp. Z020]|nr:2-dehydro-3-deoxyphosphogluconate aldolase [Subtercola sp. Z020]
MRQALPARLARDGVVAVVRAKSVDRLALLIEALVAGGVSTVELTLTTPGLMGSFGELRDRFDGVADLGIGTVQTLDEVRQAVDAGTGFIVTPTMNTAVVEHAVRAGVPVMPGGLTPTELATGWSLGAAAVKLFPASTVGPSYIGHLHGPFPDIDVLPSGGVGLSDIGDWIRAGAPAVSLGGPLLGDAPGGGDLAALTDRAKRAIGEVERARAVTA